MWVANLYVHATNSTDIIFNFRASVAPEFPSMSPIKKIVRKWSNIQGRCAMFRNEWKINFWFLRNCLIFYWNSERLRRPKTPCFSGGFLPLIGISAPDAFGLSFSSQLDPGYLWSPFLNQVHRYPLFNTSVAHRIENPIRRTSKHIALYIFKPLHNSHGPEVNKCWKVYGLWDVDLLRSCYVAEKRII